MKGDDMTRRTLLRLTAGGGLVLLGGGVALLGGAQAPNLMRASRSAMGTRATILLAHSSPKVATTILQAAFDDITEVERQMSRFRADSDVGRLNASRERWIAVVPSTADVLHSALHIAQVSEGHFDPCLDGLLSQWGFHDHNYPSPIPEPSSTLRKAGQAFYHGLAHRRRGRQNLFRLTALSPGIDLGGIAKGYAIDRAAKRLREGGVRHALINVGDDILALGGHPDGGPWRVGIRHPRQPGMVLQVLALREQAVATSGDYVNSFSRHGRRYAHLLDPHSGRPAETHRSLTVTAPSAMLADALATAAFTSPPGKVSNLLKRAGAAAWLAVDAAGRTYGSLHGSA
jgi:thiamine biosynthesis lipoprotein